MRKDFPKAKPNSKGGYLYRRGEGGSAISNTLSAAQGSTG